MSTTRNTVLEHVRPRPVARIPDVAPAAARRRTAAAIEATFGLSPDSARAIADAMVEHGGAREAIRRPERRRVPGGNLLMIAADAWAPRLGFDPANLRTAPNQVHPFAVEPGAGAENSRFAPVRPPHSDPSGRPELVGEVESRVHLDWAYGRAAEYVLTNNNWSESIAVQGVMEAVWVSAVRYAHRDDGSELGVAQSSEGSSRVTCAHYNLAKVLPFDTTVVMYELKDQTLRSWINQFNNRIDLGTMNADWEAAARSLIIPALFIVGFEPSDPDDAPPFHVAVQSLVALRHVDPPAPWGEAAEMEALADGVLDELERQRLVRPDRRRWLAGSLTREESTRSHFSPDPSVRAAAIVHLFTSTDQSTQQAIRAAVTAQSTRRQIRAKLKDQMASALIMRSLPDGDRNRERIRKYMRDGVAQDWHRRTWKATQRPIDELEAAALHEVGAMEKIDAEPGPASLELAARAMYPLITGLHLHADRGTANNDQPDRRGPGQVLEAMRHTARGVRQLSRALRDHATGDPVTLVDNDGHPVIEGNRAKVARDIDLRDLYPHGSRTTRPNGPADTPGKKLAVKVADLSDSIGKLTETLGAIKTVRSDRGGPLIEEAGIASTHVRAWLDDLDEARDQLMRWKLIHELHSATAAPAAAASPEVDADTVTVYELDDLNDEQLEYLAQDLGVDLPGNAGRDEVLDALAERIRDREDAGAPESDDAADAVALGGDRANGTIPVEVP